MIEHFGRLFGSLGLTFLAGSIAFESKVGTVEAVLFLVMAILLAPVPRKS